MIQFLIGVGAGVILPLLIIAWSTSTSPKRLRKSDYDGMHRSLLIFAEELCKK